MPEIAGWDSFYVIIGSSAAALTGLMFVVIALTGEVTSSPGMIETIRAVRIEEPMAVKVIAAARHVTDNSQ